MEKKKQAELFKELIEFYVEESSDEAKSIRAKVKEGNSVKLFLFFRKKLKGNTDIKTNPFAISFFYFLSYVSKYNNGSELIEILSYLVDDADDNVSYNAADSLKTTIAFLNQMGVSLDDIDWPNKKKLSREYGNQSVKKTSTLLTSHIVKDLIDKNREKYLSNPVHFEREQNVKELTEKLRGKGFYDLEKVKALNQKGQRILIESILDNKMPFGYALFNHLGFLTQLDRIGKSGRQTNMFVAHLYNPDASDDTNSRKTRNSLLKPASGYNAKKHTPVVIDQYEKLKKDYPR